MNGEADTYPKLTVLVRGIDRVDAISELEAGELELAFARLDAEAGNATATLPLTEDRLAVALPTGHPLAAQSRIHEKNMLVTADAWTSNRHHPMVEHAVEWRRSQRDEPATPQ